MNRLCPTQTLFASVRQTKAFSFACNHRMKRRNYCDIRTKVAVLPYGYFRIVLTGEIKVDKSSSADFCMNSVMESNRPLQIYALVKFAEYLSENCIPFSGLVLLKPIKINIKFVSFQFSFFSPRFCRAEKKSVSVVKHFISPLSVLYYTIKKAGTQ